LVFDADIPVTQCWPPLVGPTGRNFAAGMSGGVAYVYDGDGLFRTNVNGQSVELDALDAEDKQVVRGLIEKHVALTGSERGKKLLESFEREHKRFIKVMPTDYKRVLTEKKQKHVVPALNLAVASA
jgi:glutamate synthase (NADPH/NADH) large chain